MKPMARFRRVLGAWLASSMSKSRPVLGARESILIVLQRHFEYRIRYSMKSNLTIVTGSIVAPRGFRASGVFCDIKRLGTGKGSEKGQKKDLALIVSDAPATV